jgi:ribonuclease-3
MQAFVPVPPHLHKEPTLHEMARLTLLGEAVISLISIQWLQANYPDEHTVSIQQRRNNVLSTARLAFWAEAYSRAVFNHPLARFPWEIRTMGQCDRARAFAAYTGAIYEEWKFERTAIWLVKLIEAELDDPDYDTNRAQVDGSSSASEPALDMYTIRDHDAGSNATGDTSVRAPSPTLSSADALHFHRPDAVENVEEVEEEYRPRYPYAVLGIFQQRVQQLGYNVDWVETSLGMPHSPIWIVQAKVNNNILGQGRGTTKKAAKEAAAQIAFEIVNAEGVEL